MQLGDILVGRGLVDAADIEAALARQLTEGGRLGDNLIAMGLLTADLPRCEHGAGGARQSRRDRHLATQPSQPDA
jgi:hypothetical protein